jgi:hypothetical protein
MGCGNAWTFNYYLSYIWFCRPFPFNAHEAISIYPQRCNLLGSHIFLCQENFDILENLLGVTLLLISSRL